MEKLKITGKELMEFGMVPGKTMGIAIDIINKNYQNSTLDEIRVIVTVLNRAPEFFIDHKILGPLAELLIPTEEIFPHEKKCTEGVG